MKAVASFIVLIAALLLMAACSSDSEESVDRESADVTPTSEAASTAQPTRQKEAEPSVAPTAIPTPAPTPPPTPEPATAPPPAPEPVVEPPPPPPLPQELVGVWTQSNYLYLPGSYTQRIYRFQPNGTYDYSNQYCASYQNCTGGQESGIVTASEGILTLQPQFSPIEGPRAFPYAVAYDPAGSLTLRLTTPDYVDVFYWEQ